MNVLDENIPEDQRQLLRSWRIRAYQIGREIGKRMGRVLQVSQMGIRVLHLRGHEETVHWEE